MIEISSLTKSYGTQTVLSNVDLSVSNGQVHGLIGVSGVGKSTLLRCINGLEGFDAGNLHVDGVDIASLGTQDLRSFRKSIGMIFQNFALLERKTAIENVMLPMECWGRPREKRLRRAEELLDLVGILEKRDARPRALSGGQKQRVAVARALALEPKVLLCDEATSSLDPRTTKSVLALLADINAELGITILVVTHEMDVIKTICDRMSIMEDGSVVASGPVEELFIHEPPPLTSLIGRVELPVPEGHSAINVTLRERDLNGTVLADLAKDLGIPFSLISARVDVCRGNRIAHVYLAVRDEHRTPVLEYLEHAGVLGRTVGPRLEGSPA